MKKIINIFLTVSFVIANATIAISQTGSEKIKLNDVIKSYRFFPKSVYGIRSMNDGVTYTALENNTMIIKHSYETGEVLDTIINIGDHSLGEFTHFSNYSFSDDESKILLTTNRKQIFRHSFTAEYYIYYINNNIIQKLSGIGEQQLATFSPDGNKVAFVRKNNLFITDLITNEERQITNDGKHNRIINGAPDWVYEEEFGFSKGFSWSPDGQSLAFMKFDETEVKEFSMTVFAGQAPEIEENKLYPENRSWKYPKAGEDNSLVSVHVYNLMDGKTSTMDVGPEKDQYIPRIKWTNNSDLLCVYRLNRLQNKLEFLISNKNSGKSRVMYTDENTYYIDENNYDFLTFLEDNKHFVVLNEKDGWNHVYLYGLDGALVDQVTKGEWDVTDFYGYDPKEELIFYQSCESSPIERDVYSIKINGDRKKKLSHDEGVNRADFSQGFKYFINFFSSSTTLNVVKLFNSKGKLIRTLEDNNVLKEKLSDYRFNYKEFFSFKTSEGVELNGWMIKPPDFDKNYEYPVLMYQYSGPASQKVMDNWEFGWNNYIAQEGYIVACVDGRGTGGRGEEFRKMTYLQLGKYETIDQVEAAQYFASQPFVDASRIGIWGWSYGGFMTLLCMTKGEGIFKAGVAVAPVSSWRYYDNIYTERFMRKPNENPDGYDNNAPLNFADRLQGRLLIIHGAADDNVHVQNTLEFAERLVQADKDFDMMIYTNRNHSIYGGNTRNHLYKKMTKFIFDNL